MEYTPDAVLSRWPGLPEASSDANLRDLSAPTLVRSLGVGDFNVDGEWLILWAGRRRIPLPIRKTHMMAFGGESISALDYLRRVLERDDRIDCVVGPSAFGRMGVSLEYFWVHVVYTGQARDSGSFSRKEDGLFAMRAKAGEKAERVVARMLAEKAGHVFPLACLRSPGHFEIRHGPGKTHRQADLTCASCGLQFEIKKRNRDQRFRVSHSENRPFSSENSGHGWHAFVFPDMKPRFVANRIIATAISENRFEPGSDQYDAWADLPDDAIHASMEPPPCRVSLAPPEDCGW